MTRLRPGVRATTLPRGVHVRGWTTSFTVEGGAGVPELWRRLEEALRGDGLDALLAGAGPKASRVLKTLLDTLAEHGMLMPPTSRAESGEAVRDWLGALAPDPEAGSRVLREVSIAGYASPTADGLAEAVRRSLSRSDAAAAFFQKADEPPGQVVLETSGHAVAVRVSGGVGFVTEPLRPGLVRDDAGVLAERLGLAAPAPAPVSALPPAPGPLTALLAGAAVQRLICAVTGLPDPATVGENPRLPQGWPSVLLATADPLHAEYHPWRGRPPSAPTTLAEALRIVEALCDDRTGSLPEASPGSLPQLPAASAGCRMPGATVTATAARVDLARIEAMCRAAEILASGTDPLITVGMDHDHAVGRCLRSSALKGAFDQEPAEGWESDRHAGHWWRVLTARLGYDARLSVSLIADGVFRAEIRETGPILAAAVEATAGDAVAFAALGAVGRLQTHRAVSGPFHHVAPSGALAPLAASGLPIASWEDPGSTAAWLRDVADRQPGLLDRLSGLVGPVRRPALDPAEFPWAEALTVVAPGGAV